MNNPPNAFLVALTTTKNTANTETTTNSFNDISLCINLIANTKTIKTMVIGTIFPNAEIPCPSYSFVEGIIKVPNKYNKITYPIYFKRESLPVKAPSIIHFAISGPETTPVQNPIMSAGGIGVP